MDRPPDFDNCVQHSLGDSRCLCNHAGFLDRYDWGFVCGNCGASFVFKVRAIDPPAPPPQPNQSALSFSHAYGVRVVSLAEW